jgi:hypothetical protein
MSSSITSALGWSTLSTNAVSTGNTHLCVARNGLNAYCTGANNLYIIRSFTHSFILSVVGAIASDMSDHLITYRYGQLTAPVDQFTRVAAGGTHSCGLKSTGYVVCWYNLPPLRPLSVAVEI